MIDHSKKSAIEKLRARVAETTTRRDGVITVVGLPPCSCNQCRACEAREILEYIDSFDARIEALSLDRDNQWMRALGFGEEYMGHQSTSSRRASVQEAFERERKAAKASNES